MRRKNIINKRRCEFEEMCRCRFAKFDAEFKHKNDLFDKYKTEMESKFKDHQHKIDTYDDVVGERDKYLKEMNELREQLETMTSERDKYKITVETMMRYRK